MIMNDRISVNHRNKDFDKKSNVYLSSSQQFYLLLYLFIGSLYLNSMFLFLFLFINRSLYAFQSGRCGISPKKISSNTMSIVDLGPLK